MEQRPPLSPRFPRRLGRPARNPSLELAERNPDMCIAMCFGLVGVKNLVVDLAENVPLSPPSFALRLFQ